MDKNAQIEQNLKALREKREQNIAKYGWTFMGVFAGEDFPAFGYTIGLQETYNHPEIIIVGLPIEAMSVLAENIVRLLDDKGEKMDVTKKYQEIAIDFDMCFVQVEDKYKNDLMSSCVQRYGESGFKALQLVWPDQNNIFPWEDGHNSLYDKSQPLLGGLKGGILNNTKKSFDKFVEVVKKEIDNPNVRPIIKLALEAIKIIEDKDEIIKKQEEQLRMYQNGGSGTIYGKKFP